MLNNQRRKSVAEIAVLVWDSGHSVALRWHRPAEPRADGCGSPKSDPERRGQGDDGRGLQNSIEPFKTALLILLIGY